MAANAPSGTNPHTTGTDFFIMPAFSAAIFSQVPPKSAVWSRPMEVIAQMSGLTMFVESNRPPSPTSTTAASTLASANAQNARSVIYSKNDGYAALSEGSKILVGNFPEGAYAK